MLRLEETFSTFEEILGQIPDGRAHKPQRKAVRHWAVAALWGDFETVLVPELMRRLRLNTDRDGGIETGLRRLVGNGADCDEETLLSNVVRVYLFRCWVVHGYRKRLESEDAPATPIEAQNARDWLLAFGQTFNFPEF